MHIADPFIGFMSLLSIVFVVSVYYEYLNNRKK